MRRLNRWFLLAACSLVMALCVTVAWGAHQAQRQLAEKMIRLHVIANSDSEADQALKLRVRDAILAEAEEILTACADLPEAEAQLGAALERMTAIAEATVAQAGYDYEVSAVLSYEVYPTRDYETFRLPAGQYLSLRMTIGAGAGRNWWCVVFPPLCNAATTEEFVKTAEGAGLTAEELALLTEESEGVVVRFKVIEWVEGIVNG
ncbi:MAG: stage II sporulation protein R [Oscillospiraceae bacterium]|jgi:stage II sporulation protein R|nr:stage II sporulation protein R [Oscillospiraceae bacterium]MCI9588108.1 stage II sporulation protein R [Oscillospiraceae bacterium]